IGGDGSQEEVDAALKLGLPIQLGDFRDFLRARPAALDLIILRNVIEHFYKAEIVDLLRVARRSLREGGRVFVQVPNAETPFGSRLRYADFTHEIAFTTSSISQVLRVCGYADIQTGPLRPAFRGWQRFLWKSVEWLYRTMLYAELRQTDFVLTQDLYAVA